MVTMMGLTWIFGYFLLIPYNVTYESVMQWLFTIFNVFQVGYTNNYITRVHTTKSLLQLSILRQKSI